MVLQFNKANHLTDVGGKAPGRDKPGMVIPVMPVDLGGSTGQCRAEICKGFLSRITVVYARCIATVIRALDRAGRLCPPANKVPMPGYHIIR